MKNQFKFLGIQTKERKRIFQEFWKREKLPPFSDLEKIIEELFELPEREFQYFAIELTGKFRKEWRIETIEIFEKMAVSKSWWDSVDYFRSVCLTPFFTKFPETRATITERWIDSGNIWLQRLSVICQLGRKTEVDTELLFRNIRRLADSKEFFVQKGIGWALRDLAWKNPNLVKNFVEQNKLKPLSRREALKNL